MRELPWRSNRVVMMAQVGGEGGGDVGEAEVPEVMWTFRGDGETDTDLRDILEVDREQRLEQRGR